MDKYRYAIWEDDFGGLGLGWDGETPTQHKVYILTNKPPKRKHTEKLVNYVAPTLRQVAFLRNWAHHSDSFIKTRTKKECTTLIAAIIDGWNADRQCVRSLTDDDWDSDMECDDDSPH